MLRCNFLNITRGGREGCGREGYGRDLMLPSSYYSWPVSCRVLQYQAVCLCSWGSRWNQRLRLFQGFHCQRTGLVLTFSVVGFNVPPDTASVHTESCNCASAQNYPCYYNCVQDVVVQLLHQCNAVLEVIMNLLNKFMGVFVLTVKENSKVLRYCGCKGMFCPKKLQ